MDHTMKEEIRIAIKNTAKKLYMETQLADSIEELLPIIKDLLKEFSWEDINKINYEIIDESIR